MPTSDRIALDPMAAKEGGLGRIVARLAEMEAQQARAGKRGQQTAVWEAASLTCSGTGLAGATVFGEEAGFSSPLGMVAVTALADLDTQTNGDGVYLGLLYNGGSGINGTMWTLLSAGAVGTTVSTRKLTCPGAPEAPAAGVSLFDGYPPTSPRGGAVVGEIGFPSNPAASLQPYLVRDSYPGGGGSGSGTVTAANVRIIVEAL